MLSYIDKNVLLYFEKRNLTIQITTMEKLKKRFKLWDTKFRKLQYQSIYEEFKNSIIEKKFSATDEASFAYWCLVSMNITAKKTLNNTCVSTNYLADLYCLSKFCCEIVSKLRISTSHDFITSVFYICKILLSQKCVTEACEICQFVFRYYDEEKDAKSCFQFNEVNVPASFVLLFLHSHLNLSVNSNEKVKLFQLWSTIFKNAERRIIRVNITKVVEYFSSFLQKMTKEDFFQFHQELTSLIRVLGHGINSYENAERIHFKFLRSNIHKLCEFSAKSNQTFFLECLGYQEERNSVAIQFCENIYRICIGSFESGDASELINVSNNRLNMLIENESCVLDDVIYCAATIIVKMRLERTSEYSIEDITPVRSLFTILLTLARRLSHIDINELFLGRKEEARKIDTGTVVVLACDIMFFCNSTRNWQLADDEIYKSVFDAQELAIKSLNSMDEKRKEQIQQVFCVNCVNMCRAYMIGNLYTQCKELAINMLRYLMTLEIHKLCSPNFKSYVIKLVTCLGNTYRALEMYEDWLNTVVSWSVITPCNATIFMQQYCSAKHKLSMVNPKSESLERTCIDFLRRGSLWKHENLENYSSIQIRTMELKAYLTNNLILSKPITKLLEEINSNSLNTILLGDTYYAKFRLKLLQFRDETEAEVKSLAPNKSDPTSKDNDYVLAGYTFHKQKDVLKLLNTAVENWAIAIKQISNKRDVKKLYLKEFELSYLKEAALVYRQYCDLIREIEAWKLVYIASKYIHDETMAVDAFSNLMCTSWRTNLKWKKEVEEEMLPKVDETSKLRYQLDHFNRCLIEGFTPEDKKSLKEITFEYVKKHKMQAKYCYLMARCYFYRIFEDTADSFAMSYKTILAVTEIIKSATWNCFAETCECICMMLDVSLFMVTRCTEKFEFHNAKNFTEESLKLAQVLGLPLRTCQFLNISAFLDSITGCLEDCYVKLQYASSILGHNMKPMTKIHSGYEPSITFSAGDLRFVSNDYDIDFEDNPALNSELQFEMPAFALHERKCECDICANGDYLKVYCELMSLYGIYFRLLKKWEQSDGFFQGVFRLLKFAKKRMDILELKASILIQCGNYWAARERFEEAFMCNKKSQVFQSISQLSNLALKRACEEQEWQFFAIKLNEEMVKSRTVKERKDAGIPKLDFLEQAEAPRTSKKLRDKVVTTPITPCPRKSRKVLLFDDFSTPPSENTTENEDFHTPPAIVMDLPSTVRTRRTRAKR